MKENGLDRKHFKKTILPAALIIGAITMIFQGFTMAATAAEYNKTNTIPTSYVNTTDGLSKTSLPEGYKKTNYMVKLNDLPYYKKNTPMKKDMTKEAAAELAAQYLWQVYGANMKGQTIEMGYNTATDNTPRPTWTADVEVMGQNYQHGYRVDGYSVWLDSVTGDLLSIGLDRTLEAKVKAGPDVALDKSKYEAVAKNLAEKYNIVHSDIESINCTGQGADFSTNTIGTYGDPDVSFEIHGKNGEVALMTISRYDEVLKGIMYNGQYKYDLLRFEKMEKESQAKAQSNRGAATVTNGNITSSPAIMSGN